MDGEKAKVKIALGVDTGVGIRDSSAHVQVLGCGLSFGRETGISIFGSQFKLKFW